MPFVAVQEADIRDNFPQLLFSYIAHKTGQIIIFYANCACTTINITHNDTGFLAGSWFSFRGKEVGWCSEIEDTCPTICLPGLTGEGTVEFIYA